MKKIQFVLFFYFLLLALAFGKAIPLTQDEAYYLTWSHKLAMGYFDHPPMVAWLALFGRYGTALLFALEGVILFRTFKMFCNASTAVLGAFLICTSLGAIANGFLVTPDAPLIFFWICATHEFFAVLTKGDFRRFLSLGVFCGLGFLSKYTFVLFPLALVIFMLRHQRSWFKRKELYFAAMLATAIFSPNLIWNFQHDWITFRFQLKHGADAERPRLISQGFPKVMPLQEGMRELQIAKNFERFEEPEEKKIHREEGFFEKAFLRFCDFVGGQLMVWGGSIFAILFMFLRSRKSESNQIRSAAAALALTPLVFFGVLSPFTKIEANWPAMYIVGAGLFLSVTFLRHIKMIRYGGAFNVFLAIVIALTSQFSSSKYIRKRNRLANETYGYLNLANTVLGKDNKVLTDTYQLASMLRHYGANSEISQLPRVNRDSQFTLDQIPFENFFDHGRMTFVSSETPPPKLDGLRISRALQFRMCSNRTEIVFDEFYDPKLVCLDYDRKWFIYDYERVN